MMCFCSLTRLIGCIRFCVKWLRSSGFETATLVSKLSFTTSFSSFISEQITNLFPIILRRSPQSFSSVVISIFARYLIRILRPACMPSLFNINLSAFFSTKPFGILSVWAILIPSSFYIYMDELVSDLHLKFLILSFSLTQYYKISSYIIMDFDSNLYMGGKFYIFIQCLLRIEKNSLNF